jgi:hypothetical protein
MAGWMSGPEITRPVTGALNWVMAGFPSGLLAARSSQSSRTDDVQGRYDVD